MVLLASFHSSVPIEDVKVLGTDARCRGEFSMWLRRLTTKSLFITRKGHLGMGPRFVHAGDQVCILDRAVEPHLLREVDGHWIHIGMAHIPSLVDDNPGGMVERGELKLQAFDIH